MTTTETVERRLIQDLASRNDFTDDEFCAQLYRALAANAWSHEDAPDSEIAPSWGRAEEIVNHLRAEQGAEPLALAQTGGEGEVSGLVQQQLLEHGWRVRALSTDREERVHVSRPEQAPPAKQGETRSAETEPSVLDPAARRSGSFQTGNQAQRPRPNSRNHR